MKNLFNTSMPNLSNWVKILLLLLITFLFDACKKDTTTDIIQNEIEKKTIEQNFKSEFCNQYVPAFCRTQLIFPPTLRLSEKGGIKVKVNETYYEILPIKLYDKSNGIALKLASI